MLFKEIRYLFSYDFSIISNTRVWYQICYQIWYHLWYQHKYDHICTWFRHTYSQRYVPLPSLSWGPQWGHHLHSITIWATELSDQHSSGLEDCDCLKTCNFFLDTSRNNDLWKVNGPLPVGLASTDWCCTWYVLREIYVYI